jgi:endonuclease/exonuclease/phosphatase family metal-dependent hydrolase
MSSIPLNILTYNVKGLPWCKDYIEDICVFISKIQPDIICLQEVFLERSRNFYKLFLEAIGYTVLLPNDLDITWLPSGLVTAFRRAKFRLLDKVFCPYIDCHNIEWFALKGFHVMHLEQISNGRRFYITNTHTQSDWMLSILSGNRIKYIRHHQTLQLVRFFSGSRDTVIIVGDLNCESEPNDGIHFLRPAGVAPLKKATFFETGEDLDHVACLCDRPMPTVGPVRVHSEPWSDHAAVEFNVFLPRI